MYKLLKFLPHAESHQVVAWDVLQRYFFVETFLGDAALDALVADLRQARPADVETGVFDNGVVQVCVTLLAHPPHLHGANQVRERHL